MKWAVFGILIFAIALPIVADQITIGTKDAEDDDPFVMLSG